MNAEQVTEAIMARLKSRLLNAADSYAGELAADVRERVAVPVGRSGSKVIRSKPGEPPRREFGDYQKSWTHRADQTGDRITGVAGSTMLGRGQWLEKGTGRMRARPHVSKVAAKARAEAANRIKQKL